MTLVRKCKNCAHPNELWRLECEGCGAIFRCGLVARPLELPEIVLNFLEQAIGLDAEEDLVNEVAFQIADTELGIRVKEEDKTIYSNLRRHPRYKSRKDRARLRQRIVNELSTQQRIDNDDDIRLGHGGALPQGELVSEGQAILVFGPPASGKSGFACRIADDYGAVILDSDFAMRKLPEFALTADGANLVHDEASALVFGDDLKLPERLRDGLQVPVTKLVIENHTNIVVPKIGNEVDSVRAYRDALIEKGYDVHLVLVSVDRAIAATRALVRHQATNRYVSLSLIFDLFANNPQLTYHRVRDDSEWASYGNLSNEVEPNHAPIKNERTGNSPINIF